MSEYDGLSDEVRLGLDPDTASRVIRLMRKAFSLEGDIKFLCAEGKKISDSRKRMVKTVDRLIDENEYLRKALRAIRDDIDDPVEVCACIDDALEYAAISSPENH